MIRKNEETGNLKTSFKKFSDINKGEKPSGAKADPSLEILPDGDSDLPGNPNLPITSTKKEKPTSTRYFKPLADKQNYDIEEEDDSVEVDDENIDESNKVKFIGKVAKMPRGTKASKGFNFLENVKISKNSIWYLMIEKQENELQMVKYNVKKGVDLSKFVNELKLYYKVKYAKNQGILKLIEGIEIDGNDKYSWIKNIPLVEVDGRKMVSRITEDLIKLLSK